MTSNVLDNYRVAKSKKKLNTSFEKNFVVKIMVTFDF